ncbi:MAG: MiaB/RimO family radical SAM methylthiotransferase [Bacillota bacterium]
MAISRSSVAFHTLGCKVNHSDTARLERAFIGAGFRVVDFSDLADVFIINSCTVTSTASRKSRQILRRARRQHPGAIVALIGCYPEVAQKMGPEFPEYGAAFSLPADVFAGLVEPGEVVARVERLLHAPPPAGDGHRDIPRPTRPVVVAQTGCDGRCTYCIIPTARGPLNSVPLGRVVEEVREHVDSGAREIVLAGIHLGAYGKDGGSHAGLGRLVQSITSIPGEWRLRLSSLEPMDLDSRLLEEIAENPKVAPHLHLPLQSGSDTVLRRMGRGYTAKQYGDLLERARSRRPNLGISTDIMVGFPGESECEHRESLEFARSAGFTRTHVFPYSPRPGTPAARLPDRVDGETVLRRRDEFLRLAEESALSFHRSQVGRTVRVLLEEESRDSWGDPRTFRGYAGNYLPVEVDANPGDRPGDLVSVILEAADGTECIGRSLSKEPLN